MDVFSKTFITIFYMFTLTFLTLLPSYDVFLSWWWILRWMNFSSRKVIGFSDFADVLKISLLWHSLLLQRKWVCRKRRHCKVTEISMQPEMPIMAFCEHNTEPMKNNECRVTNYVIYWLYATLEAKEKMTRLTKP